MNFPSITCRNEATRSDAPKVQPQNGKDIVSLAAVLRHGLVGVIEVEDPESEALPLGLPVLRWFLGISFGGILM